MRKKRNIYLKISQNIKLFEYCSVLPELGNINMTFIEIKKLLAKYDYDVPVIDFLTGKPLDNHGKVLVRVKRNKE